MTVDVESLSAVEFLMMLHYEGNPPDDPEFDKIRMSPSEWRTLFPAAVTEPSTSESEEETDASDDSAPSTRAPERPAAAGGEDARAVQEAPAKAG